MNTGDELRHPTGEILLLSPVAASVGSKAAKSSVDGGDGVSISGLVPSGDGASAKFINYDSDEDLAEEDDGPEDEDETGSYDCDDIIQLYCDSVDADSDNDSDFGPDVLGIFTGTEADAVLARSHSRWSAALDAAVSARPGQFPAIAYDLDVLLARMPAFPDSVPHDAPHIGGFSTWTNVDPSCPMRETTEKPSHFSFVAPDPLEVVMSSTPSFQAWDDNPNNGVALLVLAWAYIMNARLAEKLSLPLQARRVESHGRRTSASVPSRTPSPKRRLDLNYADEAELAWWRTICTTGTTFVAAADGKDIGLLWSLVVQDLDGLEMEGSSDPSLDMTSPKLPSSREAAEYLARFCAAFDLGDQCAASLAAVLCFKVHREQDTNSVELPRPTLAPIDPARLPSPLDRSPPPVFEHIDHYLTLACCEHAIVNILESTWWEPDVPCGHAGHSLRPLRKILTPLVESDDRETMAKLFSSTRAAPIWLGLLLCGPYRRILWTLDYCALQARGTLDSAAWTGVPWSFMSLPPEQGPHMQDGVVPRSAVWRLRHDLRAEYVDEPRGIYDVEPHASWRPFGAMPLKDIEIELHEHLRCRHHWEYKHWTWLHNSATDVGLTATTRGQLGPAVTAAPENSRPQEQQRPTPSCTSENDDNADGPSVSSCLEYYSSHADRKFIRKASRQATSATFKWCSNQVEKGFAGHVFRRWQGGNEPVREAESRRGSVDVDRIQAWLAGVTRG